MSKEKIDSGGGLSEKLLELDLFDGSAMTEAVLGELPLAEGGAPEENPIPISECRGLQPADAIVQGEDGIFRVAEGLRPNAALDENLLRLVDSVLR